MLDATVARIEQLFQQPHDGVTGVNTGYDDLNKKTAGLQPSDLIIVAARPSMGKTTFAMNLVENAAMLQDKPVLIFSLEMPSEQIMMRSLASLSRVDQTKIRTGQLDDEDWARISGTMGILLEKRNIYIDDSSGLTPTEVRSRARRIARLRYLGAVSSSHHYWRVSLRPVYPYRSRGRCCFLCAVCRHSYLP